MWPLTLVRTSYSRGLRDLVASSINTHLLLDGHSTYRSSAYACSRLLFTNCLFKVRCDRVVCYFLLAASVLLGVMQVAA